MPIVADWATDEDVAAGIGVLYTEACQTMTEPERFAMRSIAVDFADALIADVEASRERVMALLPILTDAAIPAVAVCPAVISLWQIANSYRDLACCAGMKVAAEELEAHMRTAFYAHAPKKRFPWAQVAIGVIVTLGVGYTAGRIINRQSRGRLHVAAH